MSSVNKVILVGRLGKDPEVRYTNDNVPVANFSIATSEYYKDRNGERQESTEWHNIVAWRQLAEISEKYLRKGKLIYVEGKLRTRSWDDKEGNKRYATEIVADNITMLGKREDEEGGEEGGYRNNANSSQNNNRQQAPQNSGARSEPAPSPVAENIQIDDDLPF
jgi:single-strand DNA-binding protein